MMIVRIDVRGIGKRRRRRRRRRSLFRIVHARGAIPNEMGPTPCRARRRRRRRVIDKEVVQVEGRVVVYEPSRDIGTAHTR